MWQRFTERARRVILLGQEEAGLANSSHVGTEHLLLGLMREQEGVGAQILTKMGVTPERLRQEIAKETERSHEPSSSEPKLTPRAKRVLELAADEAVRMKHNYIGTEHLLLALMREKDGTAAKVLSKLGLNLEKARQEAIEYLGPSDWDTKTSSPHFQLAMDEEAQIRQTRARMQELRTQKLESIEWMLPMLTRLLPRELCKMGQELRIIQREKEIAVLQDDYERAAAMRDQAHGIEARMEKFADEWEKVMNESSKETFDSLTIITNLITQIEMALDALHEKDTQKLDEVKANLRNLKDKLHVESEM